MLQSLVRQALRSRISLAAVYYALLPVSFLMPEASPVLGHTSGDQLGIAVMQAVDPGARNASFYGFIFAFLASAIILHLVFARGLLRFSPRIRPFAESVSGAGILLTTFEWMSEQPTGLMYLPAAINLGYFAGNVFYREVPGQSARTSLLYSLLGFLCLGWLLPFGVDIAGQTVILLALTAGCSFLCFSSPLREARLRAAATALAGLSILPLLVPELQYLLFDRWQLMVSPYLLWILLALPISIQGYRRMQRATGSETLTRAWLWLTAGLGILAFYRPVGDAPAELFELANRALPLMEWHYFRTIPLLEITSSHFVSDYGFGLLYQLIHGYHGLDFLIYDVFEQLIWLCTGFLFVRHFLRDDMAAFFFICLFPLVDSSFSSTYSAALIPVLILLRALVKPGIATAIAFAGSIVWLLPWRADLSFALLLALLPLIAIMLYRKSLQARFFIYTAAGLILLTVILWTVSLAHNIDWLLNLKMSLYYLSSADSYALPTLGNASPVLYAFHHLVVPLLVGSIVIHTLLRLLLRDREVHPYQYLILFMGVFYLVNLPRGIVRHGFAEGFDNFLLSFGSLVIVFHLAEYFFSQRTTRIAFVFVSLSLFGLFIRYPQRSPETTPATTAIVHPPKAEDFTGQPETPRLKLPTTVLDTNILPLAGWLRANLQEDETFLDMGNTPMLYFYAEKPVPSFFCQSPQNVHSIRMQKAWINTLKERSIPLVLMRHVPSGWWDATDEVPNEIRHYAVFDYLYQHYSFQEVRNGYEIWRKGKGPDVIDSAFSMRELYRYIHFEKLSSILCLPASITVRTEATGNESTFGIPENHPEFLQLEISGHHPDEPVRVVLLKDDSPYGGYLFNTAGGAKKSYIVRLTCLYAWWRIRPDALRVELPEGCELKAAFFAKEFPDT